MTVTVCDVCRQQNDTMRYELKQGTRRRVVDLCTTHAEPIAVFFTETPEPVKVAKKAPARKAGTRSRAAGSKVMTMEEIEALKKK